MKKNLKYVIGSTSLLACAIPAISMVSCGNNSKKDVIYDVTINNDKNSGFLWFGSDTVKSGDQYKASITYNDGYEFESIVITIDTKPVENPVFYLNSNKTELTIPAAKITGKIVITISTKEVAKHFNVTIEKDDNVSTWTGGTEAISDQEYKATIGYVEGYVFESIKITIGDKELENSESYLNEDKTELTIPADQITGKIVIKITTKAKS